MKQVFGPIRGFRVLQGPTDTPERLQLQIDINGLERVWVDGLRRKRVAFPFDQVSAVAEDETLILHLGNDRYVLEAKRPERFVREIENFRSRSKERQRKLEARQRRCPICHGRGASVLCSQCGEYVCERHSNIVRGQAYCLRCKIVCPHCQSEQISAGKRGFKLGRAVAGSLVGGIFLGGLIGAAGGGNVELMCHTCGFRWQPQI